MWLNLELNPCLPSQWRILNPLGQYYSLFNNTSQFLFFVFSFYDIKHSIKYISIFDMGKHLSKYQQLGVFVKSKQSFPAIVELYLIQALLPTKWRWPDTWNRNVSQTNSFLSWWPSKSSAPNYLIRSRNIQAFQDHETQPQPPQHINRWLQEQ